MTETEAPPAPPVIPPDGRFTITDTQYQSASKKLEKLLDHTWWDNNTYKSGTKTERGDAESRVTASGAKAIVTCVLQTLNFQMCGHPEGTIVVSPSTGKMARRYWSQIHGKLLWLITEPPTGEKDTVTVDGLPDLPNDGWPWQIAHTPPWPILDTDYTVGAS